MLQNFWKMHCTRFTHALRINAPTLSFLPCVMMGEYSGSCSSSTWRSSSWTVWTLTLGFLVLGLVFCGAFTVTTTTEMLWRATNCFFSCCLRSSWRPQGGGGGALPLLDHGRWNTAEIFFFFQKINRRRSSLDDVSFVLGTYSITQESGSVNILPNSSSSRVYLPEQLVPSSVPTMCWIIARICTSFNTKSNNSIYWLGETQVLQLFLHTRNANKLRNRGTFRFGT